MSVDVHVHPWTRSFILKNGPILKACKFFNIDTTLLPRSIGQLLEEMDESGVEKAVILGQDTHATPNPSFRNYSIRNDDLAEIAASGKGRLLPFAGVDPNAPPRP